MAKTNTYDLTRAEVCAEEVLEDRVRLWNRILAWVMGPVAPAEDADLRTRVTAHPDARDLYRRALAIVARDPAVTLDATFLPRHASLPPVGLAALADPVASIRLPHVGPDASVRITHTDDGRATATWRDASVSIPLAGGERGLAIPIDDVVGTLVVGWTMSPVRQDVALELIGRAFDSGTTSEIDAALRELEPIARAELDAAKDLVDLDDAEIDDEAGLHLDRLARVLGVRAVAERARAGWPDELSSRVEAMDERFAGYVDATYALDDEAYLESVGAALDETTTLAWWSRRVPARSTRHCEESC